MRIAYIVQQFYPKAYGSGVHAFELVRELSKLGHEVHVITQGNPGQYAEEYFQAVHIHRVLTNCHLPYYFPFNMFLLWMQGKKLVKQLNVDIIIGHGFESSLFVQMRREGIGFIYKAVGLIGEQSRRTILTWRDLVGKIYFPILGWLERRAANYATLVIAISDIIKQELVSCYQVSPERIIRIYNGVNINRFSPATKSPALWRELNLESEKIVLFVGRFSSIKGPDILLRAIPLILRKVPDCKFIFIGDGPLSSILLQMARKLRITHYLRFLGFISNSEICKFFATADVCVIPSRYEPFGLVALESLASETLIITSGQGGLAAIHEKLGNMPIIQPLKPAILANHITEILKYPEKFYRLKKWGRKIVAKYFSWRECAAQTNRILEKIKKRKS